VIWTGERILREVRPYHKTYISKVIQHPSKVMELQIKKANTTTRAGQYVFLHCPDISCFQWHPFSLTSSPEEDFISVHIRVAGDFTAALAKACGCNFDSEDIETVDVPKYSNKALPRVMVDGPFGSASEDFLNYETVLLVGAGIGVTPFASWVLIFPLLFSVVDFFLEFSSLCGTA
jgi:NADPH oxidase 2